MTLTTHAVIGAAVAKSIPDHPIMGFVAGFASHFLIDAIPHGHYKLFSKRENDTNELDENMDTRGKNFILDLLRVGLDFTAGIILVIVLFEPTAGFLWAPLSGALGGIAPDPLQFVYWKIKREPLILLQRFHLWIHAKKRFDGQIVKTILIETSVIIAAVVLIKIT